MTETAQKMYQPLSQVEAKYNPAGGETNHACSNCRWFLASGFQGEGPNCALVDGWPEPIVANGVCDRHEVAPGYEPVPLEVVVVGIDVDVDIDIDDSVGELALRGGIVETAIADEKVLKGAVVTFTEAATKALGEFGKTVTSVLNPPEPAFQVFKTKDGRKWWIARHTGKFVDREKEILADASHDAYVERVQKGLIDPPELWTWHKEGTRHGVADMVWKSGGFVLALGHFDEGETGERAFEFYRKNRGKIKLSHGFKYPKSHKVKGVYHAYNTFEITTLPDGAEAFPYTSFEEIETMTLTAEQRAFIDGVGGGAMLKRVEAADTKALNDTKTLEDKGVAFKGHDNFEGSPPAPGADASEAVKAVLADFEARVKALDAMPEQVKSLLDQAAKDRETIGGLAEQVKAAQDAESTLLGRVNDMEKLLAEYTALQAPASKSSDTLLDEREKTLLDRVIAEGEKSADGGSYLDHLMGTQTTVATG